MPTEENEVPHRGFEMRSAIPVLRMFDEAKAKAFYLDYLKRRKGDRSSFVQFRLETVQK